MRTARVMGLGSDFGTLSQKHRQTDVVIIGTLLLICLWGPGVGFDIVNLVQL